MKVEDFRKYVADAVNQITTLEKAKGEEYTGRWEGDIDRLSQFKRVAVALDTIPENVLLVFVSKHWDWIQIEVERMIQQHRNGDSIRTVPIAEWQKRTRDVIVYMLLLEGLIIDLEREGVEA